MSKEIEEINRNEDAHDYSSPDSIDLKNQPEWFQERIEWFRDLKFGLFIHFGIYTQGEALESWTLSNNGDSWAGEADQQFNSKFNGDLDAYTKWYKNLITEFNPSKFDAKEWTKIIKSSGANYFNITTKHHDGFCLWDSKTTDFKFNSEKSPFKRDLLKELYTELQKINMPIWTYFSKPDWNSNDYWDKSLPIEDRNVNFDPVKHPEKWENYKKFVHAQIRELMTNYGKLDCLWLDGGWVRKDNKGQDIDMAEIARFSRELQPNLLIADRTVGGQFENFITPEQMLLEKPLDFPWETCITLSDNWSYNPKDKLKSVDWFYESFLKTVAFGGNLLLGVGVQKDGQFPANILEKIDLIGKFMENNKDGIIASRIQAPHAINKTFFTRSKDDTKKFMFLNQDDNGLEIPAEFRDFKTITIDGKVREFDKNITLDKSEFSQNYKLITFTK